MKHYCFTKVLLSFSLLLSTFNLNAQVDQKYLSGAVPEKEGKVIFTDTINLPGIKEEVIYEKALAWANENFHTEKSRVVYTNPAQGILSCRCESELVFSSQALSLDRAFMNYQLNIFCDDGICKTEIKSIHYLYSVSNKREAEKYAAEGWITDKDAVDKDKLYRNNGKFRMKTIDLVDDIYNSMYISLSTGEKDLYTDRDKKHVYSRQSKSQNASISPVQNTVMTPSVQVQQKTGITSAPVVSAPSELPSFRKMDPQKIPGNIIKMLSEDWMLITAGNDSKFNMMTASWGGLGHFWEKPVAFCFINPARYTYQLMETNETYTLSFYTEAYREALRYCGSASGSNTDKIKGSGLTPITLPSGSKAFGEAWMILECRKLVGQPISADAVFDQEQKEKGNRSGFHKMYIGEILNVWVK